MALETCHFLQGTYNVLIKGKYMTVYGDKKYYC